MKVAEKLVPDLRFHGFEDDWELKKSNLLFSNSRKKGGDASITIFSVTQDRGLVPRNSLDRKMADCASVGDNLQIQPQDLAYNMMRMWQGAIGLSYWDGMVSPSYIVLRPAKETCSEFFLNFFDRRRSLYLFLAYSYGLTKDRLRLYYKDFASIAFATPTLPEQQKIASFLSAIDKKIKKLTHKKELLQVYKKGVMQKIFSKEIRFKNDAGKKFPDWEMKRLGDIGYFYRGHSYNSSSVCEAGLLILRSSNIQNSILELKKDLQFVNKPCSEKILLKKNDIAICMSNGSKKLVGKSAIYYGNYPNDLTVGAFCSIFRSNFSLASILLQTTLYYRYLHILLAGTNINNLKNSDLQALLFEIPVDKEEIKKITAFFNKVDKKIESVQTQLNKTQTFKKGLLQKMFV